VSLLSLAFGTLLVLAGVYQFVDDHVPAVRVPYLDPSDADAASVDRVGSRAIGVVLVLLGLVFLWLGQF
jgi:hypothetical protein